MRSSVAEALSADVQSIFADDGVAVGANTANESGNKRGNNAHYHTIDGFRRHSSSDEYSTSLSYRLALELRKPKVGKKNQPR